MLHFVRNNEKKIAKLLFEIEQRAHNNRASQQYVARTNRDNPSTWRTGSLIAVVRVETRVSERQIIVLPSLSTKA